MIEPILAAALAGTVALAWFGLRVQRRQGPARAGGQPAIDPEAEARIAARLAAIVGRPADEQQEPDRRRDAGVPAALVGPAVVGPDVVSTGPAGPIAGPADVVGDPFGASWRSPVVDEIASPAPSTPEASMSSYLAVAGRGRVTLGPAIRRLGPTLPLVSDVRRQLWRDTASLLMAGSLIVLIAAIALPTEPSGGVLGAIGRPATGQPSAEASSAPAGRAGLPDPASAPARSPRPSARPSSPPSAGPVTKHRTVVATPSPTATPRPTGSPGRSRTPSPSLLPSPPPSPTATPSPTPSPAPTPSVSPGASPAPTPTLSPAPS